MMPSREAGNTRFVIVSNVTNSVRQFKRGAHEQRLHTRAPDWDWGAPPPSARRTGRTNLPSRYEASTDALLAQCQGAGVVCVELGGIDRGANLAPFTMTRSTFAIIRSGLRSVPEFSLLAFFRQWAVSVSQVSGS